MHLPVRIVSTVRIVRLFAATLVLTSSSWALADRSHIESDTLTIPRVNVSKSEAYELVFRIELNEEYEFVLEQAKELTEESSTSGTYAAVAQTLILNQIEIDNGEVYTATLELVTQSPQVVFKVQSVDLVYTALTTRGGVRPETTDGVPHFQIGAEPVPDVVTEMYRRIFSLPEVEQQESVTSFSGTLCLWLSDNANIVLSDALLGGREFGHIHPDGSLHVALELERANDAHEACWGVIHPWTGDRLWEAYVLLYTPQNLEELDSTFQLIVDSYNFVIGQNIQATDYPQSFYFPSKVHL